MDPFNHLSHCGITITEDGSLAATVETGAPEAKETEDSEEAQDALGRKKRTRFTREDDEELKQWMTNAMKEGIPITGTKVFEDLAAVNGRHSAVSWNWRWLRQFRYRADPQSTTFGRVLEDDPGPEPMTAPPGHILPDRPRDPSGSGVEAANADSPPHAGPRTAYLPRDRWEHDGSAIPPPHFRALTHHLPDGRTTRAHLRAESEKTLRQMLHLNSSAELARWLVQDWVLDVYVEYDAAVLQPVSERFDDRGREIRRSWSKYTINNAMEALRRVSPRYLPREVDKSGWNLDDHDIRFIVRLVAAGRAPGRWWESQTLDSDLPDLCATAYRLAGWLRSVHRQTTALADQGHQMHRARCFWWMEHLRRASREAGSLVDLPAGRGLPRMSGAFGPARSGPSDTPTTLILDGTDEESCYYTASEGEQSQPRRHAGPLSGTDSSRSAETEPRDPDLHECSDGVDSANDDEEHSCGSDSSFGEASNGESSFDSACAALRYPEPAHLPPRVSRIEIPQVPAYPIRLAPRKAATADKFEIWGTEVGRNRFLREQQILLASWGVTPLQTSACVLVPNMWSNADPERLLERFDLQMMPPITAQRLVFTMKGRTMAFTRAAAWFAEPRRGIDIDNFFGDGPYMPMHGSHRCHHPHCVNPTHAVYDPAHVNCGRERCRNAAREFRRYGFDVPAFCDRHDPPCLMQQAALTTQEAYVIQFVNLCRAKEKPLPFEVPQKPVSHEFSSFETQLPVSFCSSSPSMSPPDFVRGAADASLPTQRPRGPTFYCSFCKSRSYRSVASYWGHIRDEHGLESTSERLDEIRRAGVVWRAHLEDHRRRGHGVSLNDPTWVKLQQIQEPNFSWGVVESWKLRAWRER
ncbi:uncharacterized protein A1O5_09731 [Cladophialophora psammophila CBS 110553]|uniref:HTH CENPB-type domain-containing protein n=1 Tax=Cladophialophora psammophila CBS 110553 TaxID=1182543 RepID=W9WQ12_9EURO|nr:uncharacterized protein A1O5_09731 [Cladophialophora psammophila CBS 110553]EXJ67085.1 hypothetical protein A1O5_09731 [Cladophialophora psammophila CBS 110553]